MPILIEHETHGRTHVYNEVELKTHVDLGWKIVHDKTVMSAPPRRPYTRKPIRPSKTVETVPEDADIFDQS